RNRRSHPPARAGCAGPVGRPDDAADWWATPLPEPTIAALRPGSGPPGQILTQFSGGELGRHERDLDRTPGPDDAECDGDADRLADHQAQQVVHALDRPAIDGHDQ